MLNEAFTFDKLLVAYKKCRRSKQHKKETINFELNLGQNLVELSNSLLNKTYKVGNYKKFTIYEPKERIIEALPFKDRVVLMTLCSNIIESKLEKTLIYDNVACRKGKGTSFGIKRLKYFLHKHYNKYGNNGYFLKCDIQKYFQSINHEILFSLIKNSNNLDEEDLWIIKTIIDSKNFETGVGLPIGNQTSQWFGLLYLNSIDRLIKEKLKIKYYVRYMDDMILIHHDKKYLQYCLQEITNMLQNKLKLNLNNKTQISKLSQGIDFLGFRSILCNNGKVVRVLRQQAKLRLKRKIKLLGKYKKLKLIDDAFVKQRLACLTAHILNSNCKKLFNKLRQKYEV